MAAVVGTDCAFEVVGAVVLGRLVVVAISGCLVACAGLAWHWPVEIGWCPGTSSVASCLAADWPESTFARGSFVKYSCSVVDHGRP